MNAMKRISARGMGLAMAVALCALLCISCGTTVRSDRASSYLVIDTLNAASGATPSAFGNVLESDVLTKGGIYEDPGQVILRVSMKDVTNPISPTNEITVTSYHVTFTRADGRNTPGVDVPYTFDGGASATVRGSITTSIGFTLVRAQAKLEAPLLALRGAGGALVISTIAEVTFYGHDQAGNQVSVTGTISVNFADWADPT